MAHLFTSENAREMQRKGIVKRRENIVKFKLYQRQELLAPDWLTDAMIDVRARANRIIEMLKTAQQPYRITQLAIALGSVLDAEARLRNGNPDAKPTTRKTKSSAPEPLPDSFSPTIAPVVVSGPQPVVSVEVPGSTGAPQDTQATQ